MTLLIEHDWNDFQVVVEVHFLLFAGEVLNELAGGDISLKIFDVLFYEFGLVRDGEVEGIVAETELEQFQFVRQS